ncbi:MAG: hypothetical protein M1822_004287 [Bathelium mastoideum]|nr:MAG: hypothetical protein M1822_004287 [Bathelium mastoideum]
MRLASVAGASIASFALADAYTWQNVRTGGGGGFTPGIVFNTGTKGVAYARTDIGGLYKLNSDDSWTPLTDWVNSSTWDEWGSDALATDPSNPKTVYAAVGMYTNSWDPNNGAIIRSTDAGSTWSRAQLPFKVGGNMPGRGMGERLAVDPKLSSKLYFGARSGHGLWQSTDSGATWSNVTNFPNVGNYEEDASDSTGYESDNQGIAWVTFNSNSSAVSGATSTIFVGVADEANPVYVSKDAGSSWSRVAGQPTGFLPHKGKLSPAENALYISYSDGSGPYDGTNGSVWRYDITAGTWSDISPGVDPYYGYGGLAVDLQRPGTIMVATLNSWYPDAIIWRSNNSGASWTPIWEWTDYPSENFYYGMTNANAPWIPTAHDINIKTIGWMIESLEIDPFDSNHWLYGTGLSVYGGHDLLDWDTKHNVSIAVLANGIEETSVQALIVPPGESLVSALGDIGGFVHTSLTAPPNAELPLFTTSTSLDYAGKVPKTLVRTGNDATATAIQIALSYDAGATWSNDSGASESLYGGEAVLSAAADTVLWSTAASGVQVSQYTSSFSSVSSLPSGAAVASDKVNGTVFYGGSAGSFYISRDTGKTFTSLGKLGSSSAVNKIVANPTVAGDVWASTDTGLFHSTNYGSSFTQVKGPTEGWAFALGKGTNTYKYNIFGFFVVNGVTALFESQDVGSTWTEISDSAHGFGQASSNPVAASLDTAGLVFVGTNGRGIFYGTS